MPVNMDHDRLFKELLRIYFLEFLEAFFPQLLAYIDPTSIEFLDKEIFTDLTGGQRHEVDLLVKVRFKGQPIYFLIHIENQARAESDYAARIFFYFARLHESHRLPVYPIAILSYDSPHRPEPDHYEVTFPDQTVLSFRFRVLQLNRLNWREFLRKPNPAVAALMTKMKIASEDRPKVALECVRMIATLKLDPARQTLIRSFMDAYLRLSREEEAVYNRQVEAIAEPERKAVMQITNQWAERAEQAGEERGLKLGEERGIRRGEAAMLLRLIARKLGPIPSPVQDQIAELSQEKLEQLGDALMEFAGIEQLRGWLSERA